MKKNTNYKKRPQDQKPQRKGPKQVVTPENPTELEREELHQRAQYTVMWHIGRSPHTESEIREKLARKAFTEEYIDHTIEWAKDLLLLDDKKYATMFAESRYRQYGTSRVRQDLTRKGIDREIIDHVIEAVADEETQTQVATEFVESKIKNLNTIGQKEKQRILNALIRRGYSFSIAQTAFNTAVNDKENEIDEMFDI